jgi:hypothetical protein
LFIVLLLISGYEIKKKVINRSLCTVGVPCHLASHCNVCVEFEFNDKSLLTKNNPEQRQSDSLQPISLNLQYDVYFILLS